MPDLSLVVPAWVVSPRCVVAAPQTLAAYNDSGIDLELIVVDNGSPNCNDLLADAADIAVKLDTNQGYSGGVNAGLEYASAPLIGVGSIDILMPPKWGQPFLDAAPKVASPLEQDGEVRYAKTRGQFWAAMFTFPREALDTVGLMDTETFSAWADRDYGIRLAAAGFDFTRVDVPVHHLASNHAHRYSTRMDRGYDARFLKEVRALRHKYGVKEWLEWMQEHRPDHP